MMLNCRSDVLLRSIAAGALIALACVIYTRVSAPLNAFLFSFGLLVVCEFGFDLYTGKVGSSNNWRYLVEVFVGNFFGALAVFVLLLIGGYDFTLIEGVGLDKLSHFWLTDLVGAIFCGALMQIAVSAYKHHPIITIGAVVAFLICGFEHSIANMMWMLPTGELLGIPFVLLCGVGNAIGAKAVYAVQRRV